MKLLNIYNKKRIIYTFSRDEKGNQIVKKDSNFFPFFYEPDKDGNFKGYDGTPLKRIYVEEPYDVYNARSDDSFSADIKYTSNYMVHKVDKIEECITKYIFIDIEVLAKEFPEPSKAKYPISCISAWDSFSKKINTWSLKTVDSEKEDILKPFMEYLAKEKPDIILAWNVSFDYIYLFNRYKHFKINFPKNISPIREVRLGEERDIFYPAGISVVDYLRLFKKVKMRDASYALDYIGEKHLKRGKKYKNPYFGSINEEVVLRNRDDVDMLVALEEKFKLLPYYDEIRRMSKVLYYNSRIVEMLLLEEAKIKNVILPNKKKNPEKEEFKGATRESSETGIAFNIGKFDLTSAYPSMICNFCLDSQNIKQKGIDINGVKFVQKEDALLPSIVKKILKLKDDLKKAKKTNKELQAKYDAIKSIVNSTFGVMGNQFFRLYDNKVASTITFLTRDLMMYSKDRLEKDGYKILYWDTDALFLNTKEDISEILNQYIQDWGKNYGKDSIDLYFEYEGYFTKLFILGKCHYYGYKYGEKEPEIKGVEIKRSSSSKYEVYFQRELLEKILNRESQDKIIQWISQEKERIKTVPIFELGFPCKIQNKKYINKPIFVRAYENSKIILGELFKVEPIELFWYIYTKHLGYDADSKSINVIGINKEISIAREKIDWNEMIRRSITTKAETIFMAMKWRTLQLFDEKQLSLF